MDFLSRLIFFVVFAAGIPLGTLCELMGVKWFHDPNDHSMMPVFGRTIRAGFATIAFVAILLLILMGWWIFW